MKFPKLAVVGTLLILGGYWVGGQDAVRAQVDKEKAQEKAKAAPAAAPVEFKDEREKASYAIGLLMGKQYKANKVDLDPDLLAKGIKDGLSGAKVSMTDAELQAVLQTFQEEMAIKQGGAQAKVQIEKMRAERKPGEDYLAANKKKTGVRVLASGLQYKVLKDGDGPMPKATDTVRVHYRGTLIDGTEFDNSEKSGGPAEFTVGQVIPGWIEALQLMKVGSKWQLFIPSNLAYGPRPPQGSNIPPNAVLLFDVELVGIVPNK
jgi:FKBP-type peptidyl-prolyl cis-trans isomerase